MLVERAKSGCNQGISKHTILIAPRKQNRLDKAKLGKYNLVPLTTWLPLESLLATAPMKPVQ